SMVLTNASEHVALVSATIATFTDTNLSDTAGNFTASINWGDGTGVTAGVVSGGSGNFTVTGNHTYNDESNASASVTLTRTSDNVSGIASGSVSVAENDALTGHSAPQVNATTGVAFNSVVVGTFTDTDTVTPPSDFTATIDWGDGTPTSGGTVSGASGNFT